jgi:hypothetical protein
MPCMRDHSMTSALREKSKKEMSIHKIHYDFENSIRNSEEISLRHYLVQQLLFGHPDIKLNYE